MPATYKESDFKTDDGEVQIAKVRLLSLICCAPDGMTQEEIVRRVNAMYPSGTTNSWCWPSDSRFQENPKINPLPCGEHAGRTHHVLEC